MRHEEEKTKKGKRRVSASSPQQTDDWQPTVIHILDKLV